MAVPVNSDRKLSSGSMVTSMAGSVPYNHRQRFWRKQSDTKVADKCKSYPGLNTVSVFRPGGHYWQLLLHWLCYSSTWLLLLTASALWETELRNQGGKKKKTISKHLKRKYHVHGSTPRRGCAPSALETRTAFWVSSLSYCYPNRNGATFLPFSSQNIGAEKTLPRGAPRRLSRETRTQRSAVAGKWIPGSVLTFGGGLSGEEEEVRAPSTEVLSAQQTAEAARNGCSQPERFQRR